MASSLLLTQALDMFSACPSPYDCLALYKQTNISSWSTGDLKTIARACIFKMYFSHTFTLNGLKALFLFNGKPPVSTNPKGYKMKDCIAKWVDKVGTMENTMHWASKELFYRVFTTNDMPLQELQTQFNFQSLLDDSAKGVMDVMFIASCFQLPVVLELGELFWIFAREVIRLRVSTVDHLNFLLWDSVLPQTVLVLDPVTFFLDTLLPPIKNQITIQGTVVENQLENQSNVVETVARSILDVSSQASLIFLSDVRLCTLVVRQVDSPGTKLVESVIQFMGFGARSLSVYMNGVELINAGCSVVNYENVHCNHLYVTDAVVGFLGTNIGNLYLTGTHTHLLDNSVQPGYLFCDTAFCLKDVSNFVCTNQTIYQCKVIFDVRIARVCVIEDAVMCQCDHMGELLTSANCTPSFVRCKIDQSISRLLDDGEACSHQALWIYTASAPKYLLCTAIEPEETGNVPE